MPRRIVRRDGDSAPGFRYAVHPRGVVPLAIGGPGSRDCFPGGDVGRHVAPERPGGRTVQHQPGATHGRDRDVTGPFPGLDAAHRLRGPRAGRRVVGDHRRQGARPHQGVGEREQGLARLER